MARPEAVRGLDLRVRRGSVYGLLGPNGAGKTTTVRMLATLLQPDGGEARVLGLDLHRDDEAIRRRISLTGQFASVDEDLSGRENLRLLARLLGFRGAAGRQRTDTLLASFDLTEAADKEVKHYSGGMRRRLDIAASLIVPPDLLFLDEPTTGLDPRSRNQVWDIVRALAAAGTTVLADHPVSGRGRSTGRAHRGHRSRPGHRRRHQQRAETDRRFRHSAAAFGRRRPKTRSPGLAEPAPGQQRHRGNRAGLAERALRRCGPRQSAPLPACPTPVSTWPALRSVSPAWMRSFWR